MLKDDINSSVHVMSWLPCKPLIASSKGDTNDAYLGMQRETALKLPMNERMAVQVFGGLTEASAEML